MKEILHCANCTDTFIEFPQPDNADPEHTRTYCKPCLEKFIRKSEKNMGSLVGHARKLLSSANQKSFDRLTVERQQQFAIQCVLEGKIHVTFSSP